ncbi:SRPBCC family protein [Nocardioides sp.]|uniref:SRPBCC family protein n=1 Tax=Nocardioides sp. TaxID=35761 RepID=UPI003562D9F6
MTFDYSRTVSTSASPAAIWALWSDPSTWASWDPAVVSVSLDGDFVQGASGTMVLTGGIEVPVTLEIVEPGARYLDQLVMGELVIRIDHVVAAGDSGAEVTVSTLITGPGANDIGPMVTADAPRALDALTAMAENGAV